MFKESCLLPTGPTAISGLALRCIWQVDADPSYDSPVERSRTDSRALRPGGGDGLIAVRTLAGRGRICLDHDEVIEVMQGTLALIEWKRLHRHHCCGKTWRFIWFEFFTHGPVHLPLHEAIRLRPDKQEEKSLAAIMQAFGADRHIERCIASARFLLQLHRWGQATVESRTRAHRAAIETIIQRMYDAVGDNWLVSDMASQAGMSEVLFRREFKRVTGDSPKKFYDRLRMGWADELLRSTDKSVGQVADELGYSSPFHFSRSFKQHFGYPPTAVRPDA